MILRIISFTYMFTPLLGCAFQFEVETSRSVLEKQYLGEIESLETPLLAMDVEDVDPTSPLEMTTNQTKTKTTNLSELRRIFNAPDIETLLDEQILGETADGNLEILPNSIGLVSKASKEQKLLAELLVTEENNDRKLMFKKNAPDSLEETENQAKLFGLERLETIKMGTWFKNQAGVWLQKK